MSDVNDQLHTSVGGGCMRLGAGWVAGGGR